MLLEKYIKSLCVSELLTMVFTELADSSEVGVSGTLNISLLKFILMYGNIKTVQKKKSMIIFGGVKGWSSDFQSLVLLTSK